MKYPKRAYQKTNKRSSLIKKYGFFQTDKKFFQEAAKDMGMIPNKTGDDIGFERHPWLYLVEAADDICYTIIDF
jgi:dGTPase